MFTHRKAHYETPDPLMRGISDEFHMCHSRHSAVREKDVKKDGRLKILATSHRAGAPVLCNGDHSQIFVLGHMEYDRDTLKKEYERDLSKGLPIEKPFSYFTDKACTQINMNWSSTANLFCPFVRKLHLYNLPQERKRSWGLSNNNLKSRSSNTKGGFLLSFLL